MIVLNIQLRDLLHNNQPLINHTSLFAVKMNKTFPKVLQVTEGDDAIISCYSVGYVNWRFRNWNMPQNSISKRKSRNIYHLVIHLVEKENEGQYECEGDTQDRKFYSTSELVVLCKSRIKYLIH